MLLILCCHLIYVLFNMGTDMGVEKGVRLEGLSEAQISKALEDLVSVKA